jgi:hypothetical protein
MVGLLARLDLALLKSGQARQKLLRAKGMLEVHCAHGSQSGEGEKVMGRVVG